MFELTIRADLIRRNTENGTLTIGLEVPEMTEEQDRLLDQLFPHLKEAAYKLMEKEALLHALAKPPLNPMEDHHRPIPTGKMKATKSLPIPIPESK